jgi:hypothetical protein
MPWDPQRQAFTGGVSRPMPGPGDLWGSPEDVFVSACANDCPYCNTCSDEDRTQCFVEDYEDCETYMVRQSDDLDELINLAGPYADAPAGNDLPYHDDCLHRRDCAERPWWRHPYRIAWLHVEGRNPFYTVRPCTPEDTDPDGGDSLAVFDDRWPLRALYHLSQPGATNTKHWRRRNIKPCQPTESGLIIGGVWSRP